MTDQIFIGGIYAHGFHGVYPDEKQLGQNFMADVTLSLDLSTAGASDALSDTVDYSQVAQYVHSELTGESVDLIETLASKIASGILEKHPKVAFVKVVLHKPEADLGVPFSDLAIVIERSR